MRFTRLAISNWKQFDVVDIEIHPTLTILTGANASGKTTLLNLLSKHFGWQHQELATPAIDRVSGAFRFFTRWFKDVLKSTDQSIGYLEYSNNSKANLVIPDQNAPQYQVQIEGAHGVSGIHIPSHRPVFFFQQITQISTQKRNTNDAFQSVTNSMRNRALGGGDRPTNYYIKETMMSWAILGFGNQVIPPDEAQKKYYLGFIDILRKVLPKSLGFRSLEIRNYELVLVTDSGDFMLDSVSGGIGAVIDLAWQLYLASYEKADFVVLIDEVENHLHAVMQRELLPSFIDAFPTVQYIVSTHSPLVVGSVKNSHVYALRYNNQNRVFSEKLDLLEKAKSATEILREVLGVSFTMPIWVENQLAQVIKKYSGRELNKEALKDLRTELTAIGLENLIPETISNLHSRHD